MNIPRCILWAVVAVLAFAPAACSSAQSGSSGSAGGGSTAAGGPPGTTPPPVTDPLQDKALRDFARRCTNSVNSLRNAQIDWPESLSFRSGETVTYHIAADARTVPLPAKQIIAGDHPTSTPVVVQCRLGARLDSVDESIEVDGRPSIYSDWVYKDFDATGVLEWNWHVTSKDLGRRELNLLLEPVAVGSLPQKRLPVGEATLIRTTTVDVTGTAMQRATAWITDTGNQLTVLLGALAVVVATVFAFLTGMVKKVRAFVSALRAKRVTPAGEDTKEPPSAERSEALQAVNEPKS